jgi:hypothetical protein
MALLTVAELREHVESALPDPALERLLASAEEVTASWAGPLTFDEDGQVVDVTEVVNAPGRKLIALPQTPTAITSVTDLRGAVETILDPSAYRLEERKVGVRSCGAWLRRVDGKTWSDRTTVAFTPLDDSATRRTVLIQLVALELNFQPGMASQGAGPWSESYSRYLRQREELLRAIRPPDPPAPTTVPYSAAAA